MISAVVDVINGDSPHECTAFCRKPLHADLMYVQPWVLKAELMAKYGDPRLRITLPGFGRMELVDMIRAGEACSIEEAYAQAGKEMPDSATTHKVAWVMLLKPYGVVLEATAQPELEYVR